MAWNEPGGNPRDPWGNPNNNGNNKPPDLDEVFRNLQKRLSSLFGGNKGPSSGGGGGNQDLRGPLIVGLILLIAFALYNSVFVVGPAERGVVTRFGAFDRTALPGPHLKLPWPIEDVQRVNVDQNRNVELREQTILTGDENVVLVDLTVQYNIKDAERFLFRVRNPDEALQQVSESALREVIGKNEMDFIINEGRNEIATQTGTRVQETLDEYETGILLTSVNFERAQPPDAVQRAFDDATRAREDKERLINEAEAYVNEVLPTARGEAVQIEEQAKAYRARVVAEAEGATSRYSQLLEAYAMAPDITRERMYLETMESVLSRAAKVVMGNSQDQGGNAPISYLPLDMLQRNRQQWQQGLSAAEPPDFQPPLANEQLQFNNSNSSTSFRSLIDDPSSSVDRNRSRSRSRED